MTRSRRRPPILLALIAGAALSALVVSATQELHVVDGDTFDAGWQIRLERARYRLAGVDTPETRGAKCAEERALGKAAAKRLRALLAGGNVSVKVVKGRDKYARGVASLTRDGHDVAETLIAEGLARPYSGRTRRAGWCR
jgi:endonuclease YncB( thermonuclease family)